MVREIRKSSKVREKSGNFKIMLCSYHKIEQTNHFDNFGVIKICYPVILIYRSLCYLF